MRLVAALAILLVCAPQSAYGRGKPDEVPSPNKGSGVNNSGGRYADVEKQDRASIRVEDKGDRIDKKEALDAAKAEADDLEKMAGEALEAATEELMTEDAKEADKLLREEDRVGEKVERDSDMQEKKSLRGTERSEREKRIADKKAEKEALMAQFDAEIEQLEKEGEDEGEGEDEDDYVP